MNHVSFKYDKEEVIDGLRFHFMKRPEIRVFKVVLILMVLLAFVGYFTSYVSLRMVIWLFLLACVFMLIFWYVLPLSVYNKARTFREPKIDLRWDDERLYIGTERGESRVNWSRFQNIIETSHFFYLYQTNKAFFLVPTSGFSTVEDQKIFRNFLKGKFSDYSML